MAYMECLGTSKNAPFVAMPVYSAPFVAASSLLPSGAHGFGLKRWMTSCCSGGRPLQDCRPKTAHHSVMNGRRRSEQWITMWIALNLLGGPVSSRNMKVETCEPLFSTSTEGFSVP